MKTVIRILSVLGFVALGLMVGDLANGQTREGPDLLDPTSPDTLMPQGSAILEHPDRIIDTRDSVRVEDELRIVVPNRPFWANVAIVNITATEASAPGYGVAFNCRETPHTSNINFAPNQNDSNLSFVPLSPTGELCVYASAPVHLVVDLQGWTMIGQHFVLP